MAERIRMIKGRLGFASFAVKGGFEDLAEFAVEHGFDLVQIGLDAGRFFPERIDRDERRRITDLFSRKNIALSFHGPSDIPLMNRHDKIRHAGLERYYEMLDLAVDLGGGQFVIHPGRLAFYSVSRKRVVFMERRIPGFHLELFADSLQRLLEYAAGRIELCIENTHALPHQFLSVISRLSGEKGLGLVWDVGHTELASPANRERIIRFFRDNISLVRLAHLHDMAGGADHKELGTGQINIDGYLEIFNTIGVDVVLEIFPADKLLKSLEYLKKLLPVQT
jgi:sugar phosphate isomerase/epimerase